MRVQPRSTLLAEARAASRERALLPARISYGAGSMSFSCLVTQISATGAKIAVDAEIVVPENFHIEIPQKGIDCGARLVWRRAGHAGMSFNVPASPSEATESLLQARVQVLEAENKALRATIEKLSASLNQFDANY